MQLINEKEAARMLGCSVAKLQKDRRIGSPIPYVKVGRNVRYKSCDIEVYVQEQSFTATVQYQGGGNVKIS